MNADTPVEDCVSLSNSSADGLTLRRLFVWTYEPMHRLRALVGLLDNCQGLKGGALASKLFQYVQTGDPFLKETFKLLLKKVGLNIFKNL